MIILISGGSSIWVLNSSLGHDMLFHLLAVINQERTLRAKFSWEALLRGALGSHRENLPLTMQGHCVRGQLGF